MSLYQMLTDPYLSGVIFRALTVGILVSLCAALLGVNLVLRKLSMIGDGLSHVGFGAMAVATVVGMADFTLEIAIPIVIAAAFAILRLGENHKLHGDSAVALLSTGAVAVGSLIFNFSGTRNTDVCNSLFGSASIITLTDKDLWLSVALSLCVLALFLLFYRQIFAITFDETHAKASGLPTGAYQSMIAVLTAVTIVLGMKMMGAIMISGLVVFPALTAMRVCRTFRAVTVTAAITAVFCLVTGFFLACIFSFQTGPCVVCVNLLLYGVLALVRRGEA